MASSRPARARTHTHTRSSHLNRLWYFLNTTWTSAYLRALFPPEMPGTFGFRPRLLGNLFSMVLTEINVAFRRREAGTSSEKSSREWSPTYFRSGRTVTTASTVCKSSCCLWSLRKISFSATTKFGGSSTVGGRWCKW